MAVVADGSVRSHLPDHFHQILAMDFKFWPLADMWWLKLFKVIDWHLFFCLVCHSGRFYMAMHVFIVLDQYTILNSVLAFVRSVNGYVFLAYVLLYYCKPTSITPFQSTLGTHRRTLSRDWSTASNMIFLTSYCSRLFRICITCLTFVAASTIYSGHTRLYSSVSFRR